MPNRKFMTENARIADAYSQMYARCGINESGDSGNGNLLRSLRGQLPIDGAGSSKTGSKLGARKVLPFEKRDSKNCCGHSVPMKKTFGYGRIKTGPVDTRKIEHIVPSGTGSKLGARKVLPFEKRDCCPTSIGRISNVKNVSVVKGVRESFDDFEDIEDTEMSACDGCDKRDEVLDIVLSAFEQIYDNLSDDDKETVDEVKTEIESILNPDDEEDVEDVEDVEESVINEAGAKPRGAPSRGTPSRRPTPKPPRRPTPKPPRRPEGTPEGRPEGTPEGRPEGRPEGTPEGRPEGTPEGRPEGTPEGGRSAWNSIENIPREPGMTDAEYAQRNTWHKIKEYARKNKVSFWEAGIALGIGAGILTAYGLSGSKSDSSSDKTKKSNPLEPEIKKEKKAHDTTEDDAKSGEKRNIDPSAETAKPSGEKEPYWPGAKDIDKWSPEMRAKVREHIRDLDEFDRWRASRKSSSGNGSSDGRGVVDQIADAPGKLIGGLGTGIGNAISGLVGGAETVATAPTRIYRDSARNIRGADYGIDADSASYERRMAAQREHEREMMRIKREEEQARWEAEQKRQPRAQAKTQAKNPPPGHQQQVQLPPKTFTTFVPLTGGDDDTERPEDSEE